MFSLWFLYISLQTIKGADNRFSLTQGSAAAKTSLGKDVQDDDDLRDQSEEMMMKEKLFS
jgi:hypothetical protein